jgi:RNA polymerase sigma-70 factor, ECF subfamily
MAEREASGSALQGQRAIAFAKLADEHLDACYRLASLILRDEREAEDATHDAVVAAWREFGRLRDADRFEAWFQRILVNRCRDRLRGRRRHPVVELVVAPDPVEPDAAQVIAERDEIGMAFARLTPDQRIVVVLRFYEDLPLEEIAERTQVPLGTVKSRLHAALDALRGAIVIERTQGIRQ